MACLPLGTSPSRGTEALFSVQGVLGRARLSNNPPLRPRAVCLLCLCHTRCHSELPSRAFSSRTEECAATRFVAAKAQGQGQGQPAQAPVRAQALSCERWHIGGHGGHFQALGQTRRSRERSGSGHRRGEVRPRDMGASRRLAEDIREGFLEESLDTRRCRDQGLSV